MTARVTAHFYICYFSCGKDKGAPCAKTRLQHQLWQDTGEPNTRMSNVRCSERAQPPKSGGLGGAHDPAVMSWGSPDMIRGSPHMIRGGSLT